jgi:hypothetical protein
MRKSILLALFLAAQAPTLAAQQGSPGGDAAAMAPPARSVLAVEPAGWWREPRAEHPPAVPPRLSTPPGSRMDAAIADAGYGAVAGGVAFGLADAVAGPFFRGATHGVSTALSALIGAVLVGMPVGALVGALGG